MTKYVTPADESRYHQFVISLAQTLARTPPPIFWHYTTGDALIKIIETGSLFSTQISCLSDASEFRYSVDLLKGAFARLRPNYITNSDAVFLLDLIDANLSPDNATSEWFVTCFSSERDDLSQWRAYGGGENGYAIGFLAPQIISTLGSHSSLIVPVNYDSATHQRIVDNVATATVTFFLQGLSEGRAPTREVWASAFLKHWVDEITYLAPALKHPKFSPEREWRVVHRLQPSDVTQLVFLQKKTLMARHLPLRFHLPGGDAFSNLLPIREIMIGPSRHKLISKVTVGDLLRKRRYPAATVASVTVSDTPYQQV